MLDRIEEVQASNEKMEAGLENAFEVRGGTVVETMFSGDPATPR